MAGIFRRPGLRYEETKSIGEEKVGFPLFLMQI